MSDEHPSSKLKNALRRAARKRSRASDKDSLVDADSLSTTGAAAVQFAFERPGLSELQKDRIAAVIADLDQMSCRERNLIKALVTEAQLEPPSIPADMPVGTQADDMVRGSLYYNLEAEEAERRRNRRFQIMTIAGGLIGFLATWGLQIYTLSQLNP